MFSGLRGKIFNLTQKSYTTKHIFLLAFFLLCCNLAFNIICRLMGLHYPYTSFLFNPEDRFGDFFKSIDLLHIVKTWFYSANQYEGKFDYYTKPVTTIYTWFFATLILHLGHAYRVLFEYDALLIALLILVSRRLKNNWLSIGLAILSYPMLMTLDRGNPAILIFLISLIALCTDKMLLSTFLIALGTSLRYTPLIFIVPVLVRERFTIRRAVQVISFTAIWLLLMNYGSLWFIEHHFATANGPPPKIDNLSIYYKEYILNKDGLPYASSLFLPLRRVVEYISTDIAVMGKLLPYIQPFTVPAMVLIIIGVWCLAKGLFRTNLQKITDFKWLIFVTAISSVLFNPVSADYYLLLLFIPLLMFPETRFSFFHFIIYGLLLAPKNYIFTEVINGGHNVSLQVYINPALMLILLFSEFGLVSFVRRT